MASDVVMPRLSDSMEEGTILKWLKRSGEAVSQGDELVEIETDKANQTYEAETDGVLELVAGEGDTLPVGALIARIGDGAGDAAPMEAGRPAGASADAAVAGNGAEGARSAQFGGASEPADGAGTGSVAGAQPADGAGTGSVAGAQPAPAETPAVSGDPVIAEVPAPGEDEWVKASPVARRMARELGVELADVAGSGPGGRIVKGDVERAAGITAPTAPAASPAPPAPVTAATGTAKGEVATQELTRLQQTIARRMAESKATAPEFVVSTDADMEAAAQLRAALKAAAGDRAVPSFNDLIVKAAALALREFPRANGAYRDGRFESYSRVNVGIAVAARDALVVPTVFDADAKSLTQIAAETRALAARVRSGEVTPPELSGGTFTVSNLGMYGMRAIQPVINPPQAAILGVGDVAPRAVVRAGAIEARATVTLTLVCDHRILYGADAAQFLSRIRELLEQPYALAF